jgi:hypothetical protein
MRLQIISGQADAEIEEVRRKVTGLKTAGSAQEVSEIVKAQAKGNTQATKLDLIGHSQDNCFLHIGAWILDGSAAGVLAELQAPLKKLGVTQVRLLGCSTATTDKGWDAIRAIAAACQTETFGTTRFIDRDDFDNDGFKSENVVASSKSVKHPPINDSLGFDKRGKNENLSELSLTVTRSINFNQRRIQIDSLLLAKILSFVNQKKAWSVPGLLALPLLELVVPVDGGVHRYELLIEHRVLRVYPVGKYPHGLIYLIRDSKKLTEFLLKAIGSPAHIGSQARST